MPVCKKCNNKFPNRIKIDGKTKNLCNRKYCLTCSPWGEHNTSKVHIKDKHEYRCKCGETSPDKFYGKGKTTCKNCHNQLSIKRFKKNRSKAIAYLGGKCIECGYDEYECALAIHHLDPTAKDPNFARMKGWSWERILKEIQQCTLYCTRCHTVLHFKEHERE